MSSLLECMRFARIDNHLGLDAQGLQTAVKLKPLTYGHAIIGLAMQNQGRRLAILEESHGRMIIVGHPAPRRNVQEVGAKETGGDVGRAVKAEEVGDSSPNHGGFEAIGLS